MQPEFERASVVWAKDTWRERETEGKRRRKKNTKPSFKTFEIIIRWWLCTVDGRLLLLWWLWPGSLFSFSLFESQRRLFSSAGLRGLFFFYQINLYIKHKKKRVGKKRKGEQEKVNGGNHSNKYKNKWKDFKKERKGKRVYGRTEVVSRIANQLLREFDCPTVNWKHGRAFMTTSETFLQQQTKKKHQEKRLVAYYYHFQTRQWY